MIIKSSVGKISVAVIFVLCIASGLLGAQTRTGDIVLDFSKPIDELLKFPDISSVERQGDMECGTRVVSQAGPWGGVVVGFAAD